MAGVPQRDLRTVLGVSMDDPGYYDPSFGWGFLVLGQAHPGPFVLEKQTFNQLEVPT
jgi:hypothetical protein